MFNRIAVWVAATPWIRYGVEILLSLLGAWLAKKFLIIRLKRWASKTSGTLDDDLVSLVDRALNPCLTVALLAISVNILPLSEKFLKVMNRAAYFLALAIALYYGSKI